GLADHEMDVERQARHAPDGRDRGWPEADVGHEVTIHDVDMEPVGAAALAALDLPREVGLVRVEDRGGDAGVPDRPPCPLPPPRRPSIGRALGTPTASPPARDYGESSPRRCPRRPG